MHLNLQLKSNLKSIISAIALGNQSREQLNGFVSACHALAIEALRQKIAAAMLQSKFQFSSYSDMAYDCIADLFTQDDQGALVQIGTYFKDTDVNDAEDEDLLSLVRRLVYSKVNQRVFRIYDEIDPMLGKILRNIRVSIRKNENFTVTHRFGELHICPAMTEVNYHLPVIDCEHLECELSRVSSGRERIPDLLIKLSEYLSHQSIFSRSVSLIVIARVFRSLYSRGETISDWEEMDDGLLMNDIAEIIRESCRETKREVELKYVGKKKVHPELLKHYFVVIERAIANRVATSNEDSRAFFEELKSLRPDLTRAEYYMKHRSTVEYLFRVTHGKVKERLKASF